MKPYNHDMTEGDVYDAIGLTQKEGEESLKVAVQLLESTETSKTRFIEDVENALASLSPRQVANAVAFIATEGPIIAMNQAVLSSFMKGQTHEGTSSAPKGRTQA